jgi:histone deacetylase complex regulatory component SIN3
MQRSQGALEGGAPEQAPSRVLKRAVSYLERVKRTFAERPEVYRAFLAVMHAFKEQRVEITGLVTQVYQLFEGHPNLLIGFNTFLPIGHSSSVAKPPSSQQGAGANREVTAADIDGEAQPVQLPTVAVSTGW